MKRPRPVLAVLLVLGFVGGYAALATPPPASADHECPARGRSRIDLNELADPRCQSHPTVQPPPAQPRPQQPAAPPVQPPAPQPAAPQPAAPQPAAPQPTATQRPYYEVVDPDNAFGLRRQTHGVRVDLLEALSRGKWDEAAGMWSGLSPAEEEAAAENLGPLIERIETPDVVATWPKRSFAKLEKDDRDYLISRLPEHERNAVAFMGVAAKLAAIKSGDSYAFPSFRVSMPVFGVLAMKASRGDQRSQTALERLTALLVGHDLEGGP